MTCFKIQYLFINLSKHILISDNKPSSGGGGGGGGGGPLDIKAALAARGGRGGGRGGGGGKFQTVAARPNSGSHAPIPAFPRGKDDSEGNFIA